MSTPIQSLSDQKSAPKGSAARQNLPTPGGLPVFLSVRQTAWLRGECVTNVWGHIKARRLRIIKRGRATKVITQSVIELNEAELEAERNADRLAPSATAAATAARVQKRRASAKAAAADVRTEDGVEVSA